jgi:HSP20 family molecular chaperone IbpA
VHGHDLHDWLEAERELVLKPDVDVRVEQGDVFVEVVLPEIDLPNLTVHVAPRQLVASSDADREGLQVCRVIDLPIFISLNGVDAELFHNVLRITAAVA